MCDEVVPGDHFKIGCEQVIRFQPMVAPLLHEVNVTTHYFFVPYRLLWEQWENFISGGPDGLFDEPLPRWVPSYRTNAFSLWDYMGFPIAHLLNADPVKSVYPHAFPLRAYNLVWNEYYRDENFQSEIGRPSVEDTSILPLSRLDSNQELLSRNWTKDYFTSALPWQQRGAPVAFPITGNPPVMFDNSTSGITPAYGVVKLGLNMSSVLASDNAGNAYFAPSPTSSGAVVGRAYADLTDAVSFDVADLRLAVQLQKWLERNARGGVRYTEFLKSHFGVTPRDDRLQRPEYIGGTKSKIVVSEVLQTSRTEGSSPSGTTTPQGTMAGHGVMASGGKVGNYFATEFGLILGLLSVTPTPSYEDGIDRQWLRYINTDFYFPEFVNLSEQGIYNAEIYYTAQSGPTSYSDSIDMKTWGYQAQYDEMRIKRNMVCTEFRVNVHPGNPNVPAQISSLAYWHMGRAFASLPPLGPDFVQISPTVPNAYGPFPTQRNEFTRPFAVQSVAPIIVSHANLIRAARPIPYIGEPGLVDHH